MGSSSTGLRPGRLLLLYGGIVFLLFVAVPAAVYFAFDPERLDLERRGAPRRRRASSPAWPTATRTTKSAGRPTAASSCSRPAPPCRTTSGIRRSPRSPAPASACSATTTTAAAIRIARTSPSRRICTSGSSRELLDVRCTSRSRSISPGSRSAARSITSDRRPPPVARAVAHLHGSGVSHAADAVAPRIDAARVEFRDRDHGRASLGGRTAGRLPASGQVSRLARSLSRAAAVPRVPPIAPVGPRGQRRRSTSARKCSASAARGGPSWSSGAGRIPTCRSSSASR